AATAEAPAPAAAPAADTAPTSSASATADAEAGATVKPTTSLPGQQELSTRKGEWRYAGGDNRTPSAAAAAATAGTTEAAAAEVEGPGEKPATLDGPREGGADDLKRIKGIGPKLETLCNDLGFYHFDQIASWTPQEVAWVDQNLEGFKGRVTRDEWVAQAKLLAEGGETDFSQKVDKGDVY
ncbi:fused NADH-quinone oxidoreductase subunit E/endonuclease, partial [Litorisediminicola beolgyonensis]